MDVVVIGGGIAGASIAYELSADREVVLLEAEKSLAMHTTGRSAATWIGSYGPPRSRQFTAQSLAWLADPPIDVDGPVIRPLTCLWVGQEKDVAAVRGLVAETGTTFVTADEARELNPLLRPGWAAAGAFDDTAQDVDVAVLHHAYVRAFTRRGGSVRTLSRVVGARRAAGASDWEVLLGSGESVSAPTVVVAAGAWGDVVGGLFGAAPLGLVARRRSIFTSPTDQEVTAMPFTAAVDDSFYVKPEGVTVLASPQDASEHDPGDPKPDQLEIARSIEAINEATTLGLRSVRTAWAGLRTFAPDGEPVVGWDPSVAGLFWFVGQGGYGIQMSPALALHGADLLR